MQPYPLKMTPCYKDYLWGADALERFYGKKSGLAVTAESWELSAHEGGQSTIANGELKGMGLREYLASHREAVGTDYRGSKLFPVLIKFLDVHSALSVQVHPSDDTAKAGEEGKAEVWYIVDAAPGAYIYYGLDRSIERKEFEELVAEGRVCECLKRVEVQPGQVWSINPGVLHSAGGGVLVAEVQQSSNTTFRAFDFDRVDASGKKRELHLERVCEVMQHEPVKSEDMCLNRSVYTNSYVFENLFECRYFKLDRIRLTAGIQLCSTKASFNALTVISGGGSILYSGKSYEISAGDCWFLPAGAGSYEIVGNAELLLTRL